mgnify:CR=1 FL=1
MLEVFAVASMREFRFRARPRETGEGKVFKELVGEAPVSGFEVFAAVVGQAPHSKTLLEHCMLAGLGVRYRSAGKSKWKFRL